MCSLLFLSLTLLGVGPVRAEPQGDALRRVQSQRELRWAADVEAGGPFVYDPEDRSDELLGFEAELASALARYLQVRPSHRGGDWSLLPQLLRGGQVDLVINGMEWSPRLAEEFEASLPYHRFALRLLTHRTRGLQSAEALRQEPREGGRHRVGLQAGSAAEPALAALCPDTCQAVPVESSLEAMELLDEGELDAAIVDSPTATFYRLRYPLLETLDPEVGAGHYIILAEKGERALINAVNEALILMMREGQLERIYLDYGLWDARQEQGLRSTLEGAQFLGYHRLQLSAPERKVLAAQAELRRARPVVRGWALLLQEGPRLLRALLHTLGLLALVAPLSLCLAIFLVALRRVGPHWTGGMVRGLAATLLAIPLLFQLLVWQLALPSLGLPAPPLLVAFVGLALYDAARVQGLLWHGLSAVPAGQWEAALALGMSPGLAWRHVILPQALRRVGPALVLNLVELLKDSSLCSVLAVMELTRQFTAAAQSTRSLLELGLMVGLLYLGLARLGGALSRHLQRRLGLG